MGKRLNRGVERSGDKTMYYSLGWGGDKGSCLSGWLEPERKGNTPGNGTYWEAGPFVIKTC